MDDGDLSKYPGLYRRSGNWYLRKRVPQDLRNVERREQVRLSLETSDRREALRKYPFKLAEITLQFESLREHLKRSGRVGSALARGRLDERTSDDLERLALD